MKQGVVQVRDKYLCMDNIYCLKQVIEKSKLAVGEQLHLLVIDLAKAYGTRPQSKLWQALKESNMS